MVMMVIGMMMMIDDGDVSERMMMIDGDAGDRMRIDDGGDKRISRK